MRRSVPGSQLHFVELTDNDLSRVWARLESKGFSQGQKTWGRPVLRPVITQAGIELVESGRSSLDPSPAGGTHHYVSVNNSHVGNMAWASQNVSQSSVSLTSEQVTRTLEGIEGLRSLLENYAPNAAIRGEVEAELDGIEAEAKVSGSSPNRVKEGLLKVGEKIGEAGLQVLTTLATAVIQQTILGM